MPEEELAECAVDVGMDGDGVECARECCGGLAYAVELLVGECELVVGGGVVLVDGDGVLEGVDGAFGEAEVAADAAVAVPAYLAVGMVVDIELEELAGFVAGIGLLARVEVVVECLLVVGVGAEGLHVVLDGIVPLLQADVLLGDVGIDASELPPVVGGAEIVLDSFPALAHLAIDDAERIGHVGVGGVLTLEGLQE